MSRIGKVVFGVAVGWAVAAPAILWATAPPAHHRAADPKIISVCLTVRPSSLNVSVDGTTLVGLGSPGVPTTCTGV